MVVQGTKQQKNGKKSKQKMIRLANNFLYKY